MCVSARTCIMRRTCARCIDTLIVRVCTTCESRFLLWNSRGLPDPNSRACFCAYDDDEACNCNYFHSRRLARSSRARFISARTYAPRTARRNLGTSEAFIRNFRMRLRFIREISVERSTRDAT